MRGLFYTMGFVPLEDKVYHHLQSESEVPSLASPISTIPSSLEVLVQGNEETEDDDRYKLCDDHEEVKDCVRYLADILAEAEKASITGNPLYEESSAPFSESFTEFSVSYFDHLFEDDDEEPQLSNMRSLKADEETDYLVLPTNSLEDESNLPDEETRPWNETA